MHRLASRTVFALVLLSGLTACQAQPEAATPSTPAAPAPHPTRPSQLVQSTHGLLRVTEVARGLEHPWAVALLPDGRFLVTDRPGRLRYVRADGTLSEPIKGVPAAFAEGQGGRLDVGIAPDFATSRRLYLD